LKAEERPCRLFYKTSDMARPRLSVRKEELKSRGRPNLPHYNK
jgi:hypothetical protein